MFLPAKITDSSGGSASNTIALAVNTDALTDNGGGTADATVAAMTPATAITDSSTGSAATPDTIAAITDIALSTAGGNTYADAGTNTAVNAIVALIKNAIAKLAAKQNTASTCMGVVKDNIKEITTELALQRTLNALLIAAVASLAAKVNKLIELQG